MNLLALDTATEACSCALSVDGAVYARSLLAPRRHAEMILGLVDEVLAEAGLARSALDALAFGRGPGSFTGVRIACGVAQGIALGLDLPVLPVSCLATLAQAAQRECGAVRVLASLDARMSEVYWGLYQSDAEGVMQLAPGSAECVARPEAVPLPETGDDWHGAGSGWDSYTEALVARLGPRLHGWSRERYPQAAAMLPLALAAWRRGEAVAAELALPVYLRDQVVQAR